MVGFDGKFKKILIVVIGILLIAIAAGCGKTAQETTAVGTEKALRLGAVMDFKSAAEGKKLVFEHFVNVDREGNPVPALAESWDIDESGKVYTFHLRKGVKFHNGTPFNASSAKFAFEWISNVATLGAYVDKIETPDDNTLKVYMKQYYATLFLELARGFSTPVVCAEAVEPAGDPKGKLTNFIGTGPFKLIDYKKDKEAVLARNNEYWADKPKVEKVVWKTIPDPHAQIVALKAGEVDIIGVTEHHSSVPYVEVPGLKKAGIQVNVQTYGRYQSLEYNCLREPFNDKKVRMALNYAVDKEKMVKELFGGLTEAAYTIDAPWFKYGPAEIDKNKYSYNVEKAKQLLTEAGWQDSNADGILDKNGKPLSFELLIPAGEANADVVVVFVQSELKKIGVDMKLLTVESGVASDKEKLGDYDMVVHHSACIPSTPDIAIGDKYHSKSKSWPAAYHSSEIDQLIEGAFTNPDEAQRKKMCNQIWDILHEQAPCMPLYDIVKTVAYRDNISGVKPGPTMFDMELGSIEIK